MADGSPHTLPTPDLRPAFGALYREHAGMVRRALRQLGVAPASLDDAVQDVFVVLHRRIDDFQRGRSVQNWLWGIARGVASGYRRSTRRRDRLHAALPAPEGPGLPERGVARREAEAILHEFLGSLDADKCAVFVLSELEGRRGPEIAAQLDVNLNTVYARLRAARMRFDEAMAGHREPARQPMFAGWLAWAWPGWLGKPIAAVGVAAVAAVAVVGPGLPGSPSASSGQAEGVEVLAAAESVDSGLDEPASSHRWPRSLVPAAAASIEPSLIEDEGIDADLDLVVVLDEAEPAAPARARGAVFVPSMLAEASVESTSAEVLEPARVVGPPPRAPWETTVHGERAVRHPTLLSLRHDFIAELLRVATRL